MFDEWQDISAPKEYGARNVRLADSNHPLDFRIGRDDRARYLFTLDTDQLVTESIELPRLTGILCELERFSQGKVRLVLLLERESDFQNFSLMCKGLMLATWGLASTDSSLGLLRALEELHRWQEMLRRRQECLLSRSEQIGLVGELLFLRDVMEPALGYSIALNSWRGPERHEQDFVVNGKIFEVKTQVVTADRCIRISSEDQLDPTQGKILVVNQGIAPAIPSQDHSRSLNSLVKEISDAATMGGGVAHDLLEVALLHARYEERPEYDDEFWVLVDRVFYEVRDEFPRIERSDLRSGIERVSYSIRVSDCTEYIVDIHEATRELTR